MKGRTLKLLKSWGLKSNKSTKSEFVLMNELVAGIVVRK